MNREKVLERVRRLRALAQSTNVHEAAAAAAAAERLFTEHDLEEAELRTGEDEAAARAAEPLDVLPRRAPWRTRLATALGELRGCAVWLECGGGVVVRIAGRPADVADVRYLFAWLTSEITRLAESLGAGRGLAWRNAFRLGAVFGVVSAMKDAQREARAGASSSALAVVDARLVAANACRPSAVRNLRPPAIADVEAFRRGMHEGRRLHLGGALPDGAPAPVTLALPPKKTV